MNIEKRRTSESLKTLRNIGSVPGVIFGPDVNSYAVKILETRLKKALEKPGGIYAVEIDKRSVIVRVDEVQRDPVTGDFIHFSLAQLRRGVENKVEIPVELKGEAEGVQKGGVLILLRPTITTIGRIKDMPEKLVADISKMKIGDKLTISDLSLKEKLEFEWEGDDTVIVCKPPQLNTEVSNEPAMSEAMINEKIEVTTESNS